MTKVYFHCHTSACMTWISEQAEAVSFWLVDLIPDIRPWNKSKSRILPVNDVHFHFAHVDVLDFLSTHTACCQQTFSQTNRTDCIIRASVWEITLIWCGAKCASVKGVHLFVARSINRDDRYILATTCIATVYIRFIFCPPWNKKHLMLVRIGKN